MDNVEILLFWFFMIWKHFIVDFLMQGPSKYRFKHILFHPGGLRHAGEHLVATAILVFGLTLDVYLAAICALLDGVLHYFIDYAKVNICKAKNWGPTTHEEWFWMLGLDQTLHLLTYLLLFWILL